MLGNPEVDVVKAVEEVKAYLDRKKFDLVDWGNSTIIECYPDPHDPTTPELCRFAASWEEFFDYADKQQIDNEGNGFPHEMAKKYEDFQKEIEDAVNADQAYWARIRAEVLPLYSPLAEVSEWKEQKLAAWKHRWKSVAFFYDPMGMDVTTTKIMSNKETGERKSSEIVRKTSLPPGFVIRVK